MTALEPLHITGREACLLAATGVGCADAEKASCGLADGYPAEKLTRTEVASLLRGPASAPVVLTISRQGMSHSRGVYLERRPMTQPPLREVHLHVMVASLSSAIMLMSLVTQGVQAVCLHAQSRGGRLEAQGLLKLFLHQLAAGPVRMALRWRTCCASLEDRQEESHSTAESLPEPS